MILLVNTNFLNFVVFDTLHSTKFVYIVYASEFGQTVRLSQEWLVDFNTVKHAFPAIV